MTITYRIGDRLYVNITNNCTNDCGFCIRRGGDSVAGSQSLRLEREPLRHEILADIQSRRPLKYREVVFCGFGEPTCRLDDMLYVCGELKREYPGIKIRLNTNGHASLIAGRDTPPEFEGLIDCVSISLNHKDAEGYDQMCASQFGLRAFDAVLEFGREIKKHVPEVIFTALDILPEEDLNQCRDIARREGIAFRVRHYS